MKQSRVSAFGRVAQSLALAAVGLVLGAGTLLAQATGKIEGRVRDQAGAPIANAQVFIVGTAFNALTNPQGYYFINNVPGGTISVRAAFIGYKSTQVDGVRVLAGPDPAAGAPRRGHHQAAGGRPVRRGPPGR
jgi:hypothetical protein